MPIRRAEPDAPVDLSGVVKRMTARRKATRVRQANDSQTRALLDACMRLIDAHFAARDHDDDDEARRHPLFLWLSRNKIAEEVVASEGLPEDLPEEERRRAVDRWVRLMEHRWAGHDLFIQDFLSYAISAQHWSLHVALSEDARKTLIDGLRTGDFPAAVHEVAFEDLYIPIEQPSTQRMQLLASILAEREPEFGDVVRGLHASVDTNWTALYESLFAERGWQLRPDVSFQDLTVMLSTAAEGMALRAMVDPTGIIDMEARTSLLGKLALALMLSCVDPGDGMPLEQLAKAFTPPDAAV